MLIETTRYELPPEGISLLGYIVRRMHKTEWLAKVPEALAKKQTAPVIFHQQDPHQQKNNRAL